MKSLTRWMALVVVAGLLSATSAMAGDCCKAAAKDALAGKACEKCLEHQCCKDAAKAVAKNAVAKNGKAMTCAKCAAKAKDAAKADKKA